MSLSVMSHVDLKNGPWRSVKFKDRGQFCDKFMLNIFCIAAYIDIETSV